jgi:hypothetical protein
LICAIAEAVITIEITKIDNERTIANEASSVREWA